jgi:putative transposase
MIKNRPRRFDLFYIQEPIFYITCCTRDRRPIRELGAAHDAFSRYGEHATQHNVAIGRYVLMPDHLHLFARGDANFLLSRWMGGLKRAIAVTLGCRSRELWQPGFFDHVFVRMRVMPTNGIT